MAAEAAQNYDNHGKLIPLYHFGVLPILAANVVVSAIVMFRAPGLGTAFGILVALAIFGAGLWARVFALGAQDRLIRLEMHLRMRELLPEDLKSRIEEVSTKQLIGLRFASDEELPGLTRDILDGKVTEQKDIKKSIKNWKADHERL